MSIIKVNQDALANSVYKELASLVQAEAGEVCQVRETDGEIFYMAIFYEYGAVLEFPASLVDFSE